jgi:Protein of unknown function (DUF3617)
MMSKNGKFAQKICAASIAFTIVFAPFVGFSPIANAATELAPGLWKITTKRQRAGSAPSERSQSRCYTANEMQHLNREWAAMPGELQGTCKTSSSKKTANGLTWKIVCQNKYNTDTTVTYVFDRPEHFTAEIKTISSFDGKTTSATSVSEGQRIGECAQ